MDFITFCDCGRPIDESFIYCPWCGKQRKEADDKMILENVFSQLEAKQAENRVSRVQKIQHKIEELEKELGEVTGKMQSGAKPKKNA